MGGAIPKVADKRVAFYQGLFQETLPPFLKDYSGDRPLVIHNDCDLDSSTLYVLTRTEQITKPGTIIIFDEFTSLCTNFAL